MRVVTRRTGLSPDVLRVWERRHGVVSPTRSAGGQRLYSASDLDRLLLLRRLVNGGHRIAVLARLDRERLEQLAGELGDAERTPSDNGADATFDYHLQALEAATRFDDATMTAVLRRAAVSLSASDWIDEVVAPFLVAVGDRWHAGELTPAHEHLASAVVRDELARVADSYTPGPNAPTIVVATNVGERHELGAMMAVIMAAEAGWRVRYLGPDLPAAPLADAAIQMGARAIAIGVVYTQSRDATLGELRALRARLPAHVVILAGGSGASAMAPWLGDIGIAVVDDALSLRAELMRLMQSG